MAERITNVRLRADISGYRRDTKAAGRDTEDLRLKAERFSHGKYDAEIGVDTAKARTQLDLLERKIAGLDTSAASAGGSMSALTAAAFTLGPALVPIGAAAVPAVAALGLGLGAAAGAAGVTALAFHGLGNALTAVDAYQLNPTTANLQAMRQAIDALSPAGRDFVKFVDSELEPVLHHMQGLASRGLLPGVEDGLRNALVLLPQVNGTISALSRELGNLAREAGDSIGSDSDWRRFFTFVQTNAAPILDAFGRSLGNVGASLANLTVDFGPLGKSFSTDLLKATQHLREWSRQLGHSKDFHEFVDYIKREGPAAADAVSALASAAGALVKAAAPVGAEVLPVVTKLADVMAKIADSPAGPRLLEAAAGLVALSKARGLIAGAAGLGGKLFGAGGGGAAGGLGGAAASMSKPVPVFVTNEGFGGPGGFGGPNGAGGAGGAGAAWGLSKLGIGLGGAAAAGGQIGEYHDNKMLAQTRQYVGPSSITNVEGLKKLIDYATQATGKLNDVTGAEQELDRHFAALAAHRPALALKAVQHVSDVTGLSMRDLGRILPHTNNALGGLASAAHKGADRARTLVDQVFGVASALKASGLTAKQFKARLDALPKAVRTKVETPGAIRSLSDVRDLRKAYDLTPKQVHTLVKLLGGRNALSQVEQLQSIYAGLPRTITTDIITNHYDKFTSGTRPGLSGHALGGYISGPGGPTEDKIPARLSNGEFVVKAAAVDHYGPAFFDQLNAMSFASGGLVQPAPAPMPPRAVQMVTVPGLAGLRAQVADMSVKLEAAINRNGGSVTAELEAVRGQVAGVQTTVAHLPRQAQALKRKHGSR